MPAGRLRADLGCGPGRDTANLGRPVLALDASAAMLGAAARLAPDALFVRADLAALPVRRGALAGAWASKSYQHVPHQDLPMAFAHLHHVLAVDAPVRLRMFAGTGDWTTPPSDPLPGRRFSLWEADRLADLLHGAGFALHEMVSDGEHLVVGATRRRSLPDFVGPGLRLLVCGLNPSLYAADAGVNYARPGNRFWPAALAAGVVTRDRDPWHAVRHDRVGLTDLVKRATTAAAELSPPEYAAGLARLERLCGWLRPAAVCVVGLAGWRAAVDRRAGAGPQPGALAGAPVYVMPSTSGLNAHTRPADFAEHLRRALALGT